MSIDIRPASDAEMDQLGLMGAYSYAGAFGHGVDNVVRNSNRPEWTLCAFDGDIMATSYAAFPFTIRANGKAMGYAGISAVGTRPEYRRRGLLRKIMTQAFVNQHETGQPVAGLWASQAAIYQRYGFSALGANRHYAIDTVDIRFADGNSGSANVTRYSASEALPVMKALYRESAAPRLGYLHRSQAVWLETVLNDQDAPVWCAVCSDEHNQATGYVVYTLLSDKVSHAARGQEIVIRDLIWLDANAYRTLWQYIAQHDLVGRVVWENAPIDDPLVELLSEPRMAHLQDREASWFRIVDIQRAVAERGYTGTSAEVTIDIVEDDLAPWNSGTWRIQVDGADGLATKINKPANISMNIKSFGSVFSGSRRAIDLYHWGLINGDVTSINTLDRMFAMPFAPHCPDHY